MHTSSDKTTLHAFAEALNALVLQSTSPQHNSAEALKPLLMKHVDIPLQSLHPNTIVQQVVPAIYEQLNSIRKETTIAVEGIMLAAESLQKQLTADAAQNNNKALLPLITQLFEQCHFHDFTGQRITEIDKLLNVISSTCSEIDASFSFDAPHAISETHAESLMHGPQHGNNAPSQDDIDKLFAEG